MSWCHFLGLSWTICSLGSMQSQHNVFQFLDRSPLHRPPVGFLHIRKLNRKCLFGMGHTYPTIFGVFTMGTESPTTYLKDQSGPFNEYISRTRLLRRPKRMARLHLGVMWKDQQVELFPCRGLSSARCPVSKRGLRHSAP